MIARSIRPNRGERWRMLPGDELISRAHAMITHGITIQRPRREVWPWLVQMGGGRAGWYSYDRIDNDGRPSADRIVPDLPDRIAALGEEGPAEFVLIDGADHLFQDLHADDVADAVAAFLLGGQD